MTVKDDGGSAFPEPIPSQCGGMSLRDYFAAKAMQGALSAAAGNSFAENLRERSRDTGKDIVDVLAMDSYLVADAMLAERAK